MTNPSQFSRTETPPGVRLIADGGREPLTKTKTVSADSVVTREVNGEDQDMLRVPVSSTRADREGDRFDKSALEEMADQIRAENPMVFDNHGLAGSWMDAIPYDSRETIGAQMDAELESAEDGEWDFYALVNPDGTHPEGERLLGQVRDEGQPIKFSVGFRVKSYDEREEIEEEYQGDGRIFTSADLMETSRVGIPANPDASVTQSMAAKSGGQLPGVQNHPLFQMMQAMGQGVPETDGTGQGAVTKDAVDSDVVEDGTPVDVDGDEENVTREEKPKCDDDADCPEGEECMDGHCQEAESGEPCDDNGDCEDGYVCVDGECVDEDEVGDDDEEDSAVDTAIETLAEAFDAEESALRDFLTDGEEPEETDESDVPEAVKEMREEQAALKQEIAELREQGLERGESKTGDPDMTDDVEPDETDDEQADENKTAMDLARGS